MAKAEGAKEHGVLRSVRRVRNDEGFLGFLEVAHGGIEMPLPHDGLAHVAEKPRILCSRCSVGLLHGRLGHPVVLHSLRILAQVGIPASHVLQEPRILHRSFFARPFQSFAAFDEDGHGTSPIGDLHQQPSSVGTCLWLQGLVKGERGLHVIGSRISAPGVQMTDDGLIQLLHFGRAVVILIFRCLGLHQSQDILPVSKHRCFGLLNLHTSEGFPH
mmetsp:Transcript_27557/g.64789  ORF Transcript_27557/g.64789 Transcript_27557/m.64789 type:complete len:216 (-) Transcript_27557:1044-1691(-)